MKWSSVRYLVFSIVAAVSAVVFVVSVGAIFLARWDWDWQFARNKQLREGAVKFLMTRKPRLLPNIIVSLPYLILPALWVIYSLRRRNLPDNACANCSYTLTAGNTTGKCPECGHVITTTGPVAADVQ